MNELYVVNERPSDEHEMSVISGWQSVGAGGVRDEVVAVREWCVWCVRGGRGWRWCSHVELNHNPISLNC